MPSCPTPHFSAAHSFGHTGGAPSQHLRPRRLFLLLLPQEALLSSFLTHLPPISPPSCATPHGPSWQSLSLTFSVLSSQWPPPEPTYKNFWWIKYDSPFRHPRRGVSTAKAPRVSHSLPSPTDPGLGHVSGLEPESTRCAHPYTLALASVRLWAARASPLENERNHQGTPVNSQPAPWPSAAPSRGVSPRWDGWGWLGSADRPSWVQSKGLENCFQSLSVW